MTENETRLECLRLAVSLCAPWGPINIYPPGPVALAKEFYDFVTVSGRKGEKGDGQRVAYEPHSLLGSMEPDDR